MILATSEKPGNPFRCSFDIGGGGCNRLDGPFHADGVFAGPPPPTPFTIDGLTGGTATYCPPGGRGIIDAHQ